MQKITLVFTDHTATEFQAMCNKVSGTIAMMNTIVKNLLVLIFFISVAKSAKAYDFEVDGLYYDIISISDMTCEVTFGDQKYSGEVKIPSTVTYKNREVTVTNIGDSAFSGCTSLTSVVIPNSVTSIGKSAFEGCTSLTSVVIPNSVTNIGSAAFPGCTSLTSVVIPNSVTSIGGAAFSGCTSLTSVVISNSETIIRASAFSGCTSLISVVIPNSVTIIGGVAFSGCTSLTSVVIPNSVTNIYGSAFSGCTSLTSVTIPESVTKIGIDAFDKLSTFIIEESKTPLKIECYSNSKYYPLYIFKLIAKRPITFLNQSDQLEKTRLYSSIFPNITDLHIDNFTFDSNCLCPKLQKLTLGKNASIAESLSLKGLNYLESITLEDPTATIACPSFTNKQYADIILYVPEGSLTAYQNADGWKNFWDIREISTSGIREVISNKDVQEIGRYNLQGQPVNDDYRGFVIVRYSDGTTRKTIK